MKQSLKEKLEKLSNRHSEIGDSLSKAEIVKDQEKYRDLSKEYAKLSPVVDCYRKHLAIEADINDAKDIMESEDAEIKNLAEEETEELKLKLEELENQLKILLLPEDPNDQRNVFLEVRAGTGGAEASIFAGDLARMYMRYAEQKKWQTEILSEHEGEHGGYKEVIMRIIGQGVYSRLKFESGAHRVQRVPATESSGRIHTSACTVAILPEAEEIDEIDVNTADLKIDTYRSSGAGGQHVNVTDSAVRITHIPTGTVVECQDERSQHKNRAKALAWLQARLLEHERSKQRKERAETRKTLVGSGDRSERIRTYNYPQGRVTDHRINLTLYKLNEILEGYMDSIVDPLIREHQAELLAESE